MDKFLIEKDKTSGLKNVSKGIFQIRDVNGVLLYRQANMELTLYDVHSKNISFTIPNIFRENIDGNNPEWKQFVFSLKEIRSFDSQGIIRNTKTKTGWPVDVKVSIDNKGKKEQITTTIQDISNKLHLTNELVSQEKAIIAIYSTFQYIMSKKEFVSKINEGFDSVSEFLNIKSASIYLLDELSGDFITFYEYISEIYKNHVNVISQRVEKKDFDVVNEKLKENDVAFFENGSPFTIGKNKNNTGTVCYIMPLADNDKIKGFIKINEHRSEDAIIRNRIGMYNIYSSIINTSYSLLNRTVDLAKNNRNFRHIYNSINDVFFLYDFVDEKFVFMSPSCKEVFGIEQYDFYHKGEEVFDLVFEKDKELYLQKTEDLKVKNFISFEFRIVNKDGTFKYILSKVYAIRNKDMVLKEISGICIDITEKKLREKLLKESNEVIFKKNKELSEMNSQINELLTLRETDLYLKTVRQSNTNNLLYKTKNEIKELLEFDKKNANQLSKIIKYIDQVLIDEQDLWQEIQVEFEKVRPNFFKGLLDLCNSLSINDLKHCYYVVTGLTGQEVANLLNISIRTVETSRYRIKKKLELTSEDSLYNYLNNF